jgi:hypothetical protein
MAAVSNDTINRNFVFAVSEERQGFRRISKAKLLFQTLFRRHY